MTPNLRFTIYNLREHLAFGKDSDTNELCAITEIKTKS
jgi:hypothetical protein